VARVARQDLLAAYAEVEALIAERAPRCEMSGRCCRFDEAAHQLWCTELELRHALDAAGGEVPAAPEGLCPWHIDGLCSLREGRPLGCRTYFCDPSWTEAGEQLHERLHGVITALHETHNVPYAYVRFVDAVQRPAPPDGPPVGGAPACDAPAPDAPPDLQPDAPPDLQPDAPPDLQPDAPETR